MPDNLSHKRLEQFPITAQIISRNQIQKMQAQDDLLQRDLPLPGVPS